MKKIKESIINFFVNKNYIISFIVASLAMFLVLSYSGVLSTGKYCLMVGDLWDNYAAAIRELCRDILTGQSIYYSWTHSLGMNTALYNAYYAFSPLNILYLLFYSVDINKVTALIIILKTGLAALSFQLYSKYVLKINNLNSVLFSICYSLCAFQVSYNIVNIIWLDALYVLPFVLLSIHIMIETEKKYYLVLSFAYLFVSNFYMGYIVGLFSVIYLLILIIIYKNKSIFSIVFHYLFSIVISVLISAVVWLPALCFLINNNPDDGTKYYQINYNIFNVFFQMFLGQNNGFDSTSPNVYCGIICLLLIPVFFISTNIEKKIKYFYAILFFIVCLSCVIKPFYVLWHAFDAPDGWYNRFSYIISFLCCVISLITINTINKISKKVLIYTGVIEGLFYIGFSYLINKSARIDHMLIFIMINFAFIMVWLLLIMLYKRKINNKSIMMLLVLVASLELIINGYSSFYRDSRFLPSTPEYIYYGWEDSMKYVSDKLNQTGGFYRVNYYGDIIDNSDTFFGYNGMADFGSAENPKVRKALSKIGIYTSPRVLEPYGSTKVSNMLLGVKYEIEGIVPSYIEIADVHPLITQLNESLALAYIADEKILDFKYNSDNAFINNNELLSSVVGFDVYPFKEIDRNDIKIIENNIDFECLGDKYLINGEIGKCGSIDFIYNGENEAYIYFVNDSSILDYSSYLLNYGRENIYSDSGVLSVSYIKPFEVIDDNQLVEIIQGNYEKQYINDYYVYYFDSSEFIKAYNVLEDKCASVDCYDDGYVEITVDVKDESNALITTIPYDSGWSAKIDGENVDIVPIIEEAFIGLPPMNKGKHVIEFKYKAKGLNNGIVLSLAGLLCFVLLLIFEIKQYANEKGKIVNE